MTTKGAGDGRRMIPLMMLGYAWTWDFDELPQCFSCRCTRKKAPSDVLGVTGG